MQKKCKIRVKEARKSKFDSIRPLPRQERKSLITHILRQEIADNIDFDIELQEHLFVELSKEADLWFIEEMEKEENRIIESFDDASVICPVCMLSYLHCEQRVIFCNCGAR